MTLNSPRRNRDCNDLSDFSDLFIETEFRDARLFIGDNAFGANKICDAFHRYWSSKGKADTLPRRSDIKPEDIPDILPHAVILDVGDRDDDIALKVRLIGTHVTMYYGEITGRDIAEMPNNKAARRIYEVCRSVVEKRTAIMTEVHGYAPNRKHLNAYAIYLPLSEDGKRIDKILVGVEVRFDRTAN